MTKLGIISDTHKHITNLSKAVGYLKRQGVETIIHLGDDFTDVDEIGERNVKRVPGVFSDAYQDVKIPNRRIENFGGWRFLLSHTVSSHPNDLPDDLKPEDLIRGQRVHVLLHGHTHIPEVKQEAGIIYINPGHLKNEDKKGFPPTFVYLELTIDKLLVQVVTLRDYEVFKESRFRKP